MLKAQLERDGYTVETAVDGEEAIAMIGEVEYHLVITDLNMPRKTGIELLQHVRSHHPSVPVVILTAHGTMDTAIGALKLGAQDFISKPFDVAELRQSVEKAIRTERIRRRSSLLDPSWPAPSGQAGLARPDRGGMVGSTDIMQKLQSLVSRVADSPSTVLLIGESGTGKELCARELHQQSTRAEKPFIAINCGAIPENLFESELFGYERGAFTGAATSKPGRFELAEGGTIFLDEIGELPRDMQVKLLRVLQERVVERVGGVKPIPVDVRVIAATNVQLAAAVTAGRFRQDLFYRLNVVQIQLPPLRERREDIPALVQHFLARYNQRLGKDVGVRGEDLAKLLAWSWPGNIRELENVVERGVLLSDGEWLEVELPEPPAEVQAGVGSGSIDLKQWIQQETARLERRKIQQFLEQENGNVTRTAKRLGISRKGLQLKMKEYGLRDEEGEEAP